MYGADDPRTRRVFDMDFPDPIYGEEEAKEEKKWQP